MEVVVQDNSFENESFLPWFRGLLEALGIARISKLRVDVDTVGLIVGTHTIGRGSICSTRYSELDGVVVVTVEGLLEVPYHCIS